MLRTLLFTALLLAFAGVSKAGLIITASNPSPITAGSNGTIDFFIRADSGTQILDGFLARITITGGPGLVFSNTQTDSQLSDPNYVFSGISLSQNTGVGIGFLDPLDLTGQTYVGSDGTDDGIPVLPPSLVGSPDPVTLNDSDNKLLLRLNLTGVTAGIYTLTFDPNVTSFYTDQNDPVGTTINGANVTLNSGQVQVTVTAVPEPGTLSLVGVALAGLTFVRRQKRIC